jgi:energy-coupling factor transporter transmembrane protein EcfT
MKLDEQQPKSGGFLPTMGCGIQQYTILKTLDSSPKNSIKQNLPEEKSECDASASKGSGTDVRISMAVTMTSVAMAVMTTMTTMTTPMISMTTSMTSAFAALFHDPW